MNKNQHILETLRKISVSSKTCKRKDYSVIGLLQKKNLTLPYPKKPVTWSFLYGFRYIPINTQHQNICHNFNALSCRSGDKSAEPFSRVSEESGGEHTTSYSEIISEQNKIKNSGHAALLHSWKNSYLLETLHDNYISQNLIKPVAFSQPLCKQSAVYTDDLLQVMLLLYILRITQRAEYVHTIKPTDRSCSHIKKQQLAEQHKHTKAVNRVTACSNIRESGKILPKP